MATDFINLITISRKHFFLLVKKCNETYRSGHDLDLYRDLIRMHREKNRLTDLIDNDVFLEKAYNTLAAWNMDQRGAQMVSASAFKDSVRFWKNDLVKLYGYKLHENIDSELTAINKLLEKVFCNLKVMKSTRRIVGVSKALHFLLPDLIMPIDSNYTMPVFYGYNKYDKDPKKEFRTFKEIFEETFEITNHLGLSPTDVDDIQWNTSVPKLIDNAIIGLSKYAESEEGIKSLFQT